MRRMSTSRQAYRRVRCPADSGHRNVKLKAPSTHLDRADRLCDHRYIGNVAHGIRQPGSPLPPAKPCWHHGEHDRENRVLPPPVNAATEPGLLGPQIGLFDYAMHLHQQDPDSPLPRDGEPYPDDELHRQRAQPRPPRDERLHGADVARILDAHFAKPEAPPSALADAFHDVYVPIHHNEHIAAAALRADRHRVQHTGRWLVRHSTDQCAATVGLALLAADWAEEDIPLIRTIGLLSNHFGPLAAHALRRRLGGSEALQWLAERVTGWGRVYVIEALCLAGRYKSRWWLLRHACDGDVLNGYFAGKVATTAHLHEAIISAEADDDLVDHTGRLLAIMADCSGMGLTLEHYPPRPPSSRRMPIT